MIEKLQPLYGDIIRNRNCRLAVFTQHHMDQLVIKIAIDYLIDGA